MRSPLRRPAGLSGSAPAKRCQRRKQGAAKRSPRRLISQSRALQPRVVSVRSCARRPRTSADEMERTVSGNQILREETCPRQGQKTFFKCFHLEQTFLAGIRMRCYEIECRDVPTRGWRQSKQTLQNAVTDPNDPKLREKACPRCGSRWVAAVLFSQRFRWPVENWIRCDKCGHLFRHGSDKKPDKPTKAE